MRIIRATNPTEAGRHTATIIASQVTLKPDSVLGLATGSSPIETYKYLVEWYKQGNLDFSQVYTVNLDEYIGLPADHEQSYARFMYNHLFDHINIRPDHVYIPNGLAPENAAEGARYDGIIKDLGGVDLQLLGIGTNGHIGFNEPGEAFITGTHCVDLSEATILANSRFFESADMVPKQAYSVGVQTIMQAKRVVMVATGKNKASAIRDAFCGPVTPKVPASILQLHPDFVLVADEEALSLM
ncbi:MAG: glucosamine-6-phosphate deaminase [Oscillospiraceae bacterium]|nr:glucosamine-6-phosphate deaminase [Oscillospiraceae bacterium]